VAADASIIGARSYFSPPDFAMLKTSLLLVTAVAGVKLLSADAISEYTRGIETWRAERVARLEAPTGWLSLIGLHWLKDGANTIGSGEDNAIVLAKGPAKLGVATLKEGKVSIVLDPAAGATIDGHRKTSAPLSDDSQPKPTVVAFGTVSFYVIKRGERIGLRVKDTEAPTRTGFLGLDYFPIDPSWRVTATWVPFKPAHKLEIPNVLGDVDEMPVPGKAVFERDGKKYELLPVLEEPDADYLFFIIADRTSGKQTYGAARFLYTDMPKDGKLVLDFNKAYNPPCAFTPFATCPLAPPENRLDLSVTAGEKKYRGGHH
jgi:uncharacterized protein (DUF1684 family)